MHHRHVPVRAATTATAATVRTERTVVLRERSGVRLGSHVPVWNVSHSRGVFARRVDGLHPGRGGSELLHDGLHLLARADDQPLLSRRRRNLHDLARVLRRRPLSERTLLSPFEHCLHHEHAVLHGLHVPVRNMPRADVHAH